MKIALYKSTQPGFTGIYNRLIRWWDQGQYSHCEIIFSDGQSASSSYSDSGVRFKEIVYDPTKWDFFEIPNSYEESAREWFTLHNGQGYNLIGDARFLLGFLKNPDNQWFCSEAIGAALGINFPWRLTPNGLLLILQIMTVK